MFTLKATILTSLVVFYHQAIWTKYESGQNGSLQTSPSTELQIENIWNHLVIWFPTPRGLYTHKDSLFFSDGMTPTFQASLKWGLFSYLKKIRSKIRPQLSKKSIPFAYEKITKNFASKASPTFICFEYWHIWFNFCDGKKYHMLQKLTCCNFTHWILGRESF